MKSTKVKFLKAHPDFAYFVGDVATLSDEHVAKLHNSGHVLILPADEDDENENPLPKDFPARDVLFNAGFESVEKVKEAGDSLADLGISKTAIKKIMAYAV